MLSKAAHINRLHDTIMEANVVAVGAVHAMEAGFGKGQPKALNKFIRSLERITRKLSNTGQGVSQDSQSLFEAFGGQGTAIKRGKRV
jgi:hypothetical protein